MAVCSACSIEDMQLEHLCTADEMTYISLEGNWANNLVFARTTLADAAIRGEVWVARHNGEDFAGIAIWFPPGRDLGATYVVFLPLFLRCRKA